MVYTIWKDVWNELIGSNKSIYYDAKKEVFAFWSSCNLGYKVASKPLCKFLPSLPPPYHPFKVIIIQGNQARFQRSRAARVQGHRYTGSCTYINNIYWHPYVRFSKDNHARGHICNDTKSLQGKFISIKKRIYNLKILLNFKNIWYLIHSNDNFMVLMRYNIFFICIYEIKIHL